MNKTKLPSPQDMINGEMYNINGALQPVSVGGKEYYCFAIHPEWLKIIRFYNGMRQVKMKRKMLALLSRR